MATNNYASTRLRHLKGSDYEVADGQPDIRGWNVKDDNGKTIGKVEDLIFDEQSLKVRYMVVDEDKNDFDLEDKDVLIPIGIGEIAEKDDVVFVPNVTAAQLSALPEYDGDNGITPDVEYNIRNIFAGAGAAAVGAAGAGIIGDEFYNHEHFNEDNLTKRRNNLYDNATGSDQQNATIPLIEENVEIGKQQVTTGGAYIRSRIVEKPVEETVELKQEHVNVNRTPVDRPASSNDFDTFKEGVIELEERAEVPVVNKQARVVEEVSVNKEVSERTETVRDTVRKTEVDVENLGNKTDTYSTTDDDSSNIK